MLQVHLKTEEELCMVELDLDRNLEENDADITWCIQDLYVWSLWVH